MPAERICTLAVIQQAVECVYLFWAKGLVAPSKVKHHSKAAPIDMRAAKQTGFVTTKDAKQLGSSFGFPINAQDPMHMSGEILRTRASRCAQVAPQMEQSAIHLCFGNQIFEQPHFEPSNKPALGGATCFGKTHDIEPPAPLLVEPLQPVRKGVHAIHCGMNTAGMYMDPR
ncbi:MAG: hypothetical protein ACXWC3_10790, partial [Burkholderiales bacterium]